MEKPIQISQRVSEGKKKEFLKWVSLFLYVVDPDNIEKLLSRVCFLEFPLAFRPQRTVERRVGVYPVIARVMLPAEPHPKAVVLAPLSVPTGKDVVSVQRLGALAEIAFTLIR